jgi:hypothetical protein
MTPKRKRTQPPPPGGENFEIVEIDCTPLSTAEQKTWPVVKVMPTDPLEIVDTVPPPGAIVSSEMIDVGPPLTPEQVKAYREQHGIVDPKRPLVPTAAELAKLPRSARVALARRCAARVAPLLREPQAELDPETAARLMLAAATYPTPLARLLRCVRRDFDRLVHLAKRRNWTDETPVPPAVFGPMWPARLTPDWARPSSAAEPRNEPTPPAN